MDLDLEPILERLAERERVLQASLGVLRGRWEVLLCSE